MRLVLRVVVVCAGVVLLCAGVLASPADKPEASCGARAISLENPAYMIVDAVVRGDRLLLPD